MAKKTLKSNFELIGIAPNLLLKDVENTAPFLFEGEIQTEGKDRAYLAKLVFYKKNLSNLKHINLTEYFHLCMAAHWATAGTFVPTNVDNQIREGLWKHKDIQAHIDWMAKITIDSWGWNYEQVTNRKSYNPNNGQVMSTHEGTWLSVAIGAYNALVKNKKMTLAQEIADVILAEIKKEQDLLIELREKRDHINFLRSAALMAHNFGDLDRVIDQWQMPQDDPFRNQIYKLGHQLNPNYDPILAYTGAVNKRMLSVENHRHMSMRQARCLRRSYKFLIPVGPFMDEWGQTLGVAHNLSLAEKAEILVCFFEGFKRQDMAFGYARAYRGLLQALPDGLNTLLDYLAFDVVAEIKKSKFQQMAAITQEEFENDFKVQLEQFKCPETQMEF
jgi:hypothetical protein